MAANALDPWTHAVATPGDPIAVRLYRLLENGSDDDLLHVFGAITEAGIDLDVGTDVETEEQRAALASLTAAALALGRRPSRRGYDSWRDEQEDRDAYVPATSIRRAFGNWNAALEALHGPRTDIAARRMLSGGKRFSAQECRLAMQLFAESSAAAPDRRRWYDYSAWARRYAATPGASRIPLRHSTITERLDAGWRDLWRQPELWTTSSSAELIA